MQHPWDNSTIFYQQDKAGAGADDAQSAVCAGNGGANDAGGNEDGRAKQGGKGGKGGGKSRAIPYFFSRFKNQNRLTILEQLFIIIFIDKTGKTRASEPRNSACRR